MHVHVMGIVRDGLRAALVTATGLALAEVVRFVAGALSVRSVTLLGVAAVAAAVASASAGTLRVVGRGPSLPWFIAGVLGGALMAWVR